MISKRPTPNDAESFIKGNKEDANQKKAEKKISMIKGMKRFTSYAYPEKIKSLKLIAIKKDKKDYQLWDEAIDLLIKKNKN